MTPTRHLDLDGIPVLLAPTTGPMRAALMFRVGRADESLSTGGITHLVEHLALHRHGTADYHYNGVTASTTTQFVTQGTPDAVVTFINAVCANLRNLPLGRLAVEKQILQTEAANRSVAVNEQMPLWRHGARDYGLPSYPEWGTYALTAEQVSQWSSARFNRANAVLWIAGDRLPEGLHLDLPEGERWPLPTESSALPVTPAYFTAGAPLIVMDTKVPRTRAAVMYTRLLERALFRELRHNRGLSYTAAAMYTTDGRAEAALTTIVDALAGRLDDALECFLGELTKLEKQEVDPAEFETVRGLELEALENPDVEANLLQRRATDLLAGYPSNTTAELIDGFRKAAAHDIPEVALAAKSSALLMLPHHVTRLVTGFEAAPTSSRFGVRGTKYSSRSGSGLTLVRGADGVSLTRPQGSLTVLFDECAALLRWPDGARCLFGHDGINVQVEPTLFKISTAALIALDRAVPQHVIIDMPQRDQASIPKLSRIKGIRARIGQLLLPARARFDHASIGRGGVRAVVIAAALATAVCMSTVIAVVANQPRFVAIAVILSLILLWRRSKFRHW